MLIYHIIYCCELLFRTGSQPKMLTPLNVCILVLDVRDLLFFQEQRTLQLSRLKPKEATKGGGGYQGFRKAQWVRQALGNLCPAARNVTGLTLQGQKAASTFCSVASTFRKLFFHSLCHFLLNSHLIMTITVPYRTTMLFYFMFPVGNRTSFMILTQCCRFLVLLTCTVWRLLGWMTAFVQNFTGDNIKDKRP